MKFALGVDNLRIASAAESLIGPVFLALKQGENLSLIGESGSGKSLLAKALFGVLPDNLRASGWIEIDGQSFSAEDATARRALWGRRIALLPQEPWLALDPTMRTLTQLSETHAYVGGRSPAQSQVDAVRDLTEAGIANAAGAYPHMLSGGMAQRVAFAISRAGHAPLLIVDEPTKGLDAILRDRLLQQLRAITARGGSTLTITHDIGIAQVLGGTVAVMLDGAVIEHGPADEVLNTPSHPYTKRLLAAAPSAWARRPTHIPSNAGPILSATGVGKCFGERKLFGGIDLAIRPGDRIAITGPSGSGKTTFGNILLGLVLSYEGKVVRDRGVSGTDFQKLYQDPGSSFAPHVSIHQSLTDLVALHRLNWKDVSRLMARLALDEHLLSRKPHQISSGELQRFAAIRILLMKPKLIFADEPTSRLDPISQKATFEVLCDVIDESGSALLLVTHDPDIAHALNGYAVQFH
jgi:peptide/nickel transport system ATP-binding protein